jgi:hypothetical protein
MDTIRALFAASDDLRFEEIQMIAEGNKVAVHSRSTGTDTRGFMPAAPSACMVWGSRAISRIPCSLLGPLCT